MLDLSIVIVSWNAKKYILDCLASIPQAAGPLSYEVIVVDNDSSDGSPEAIEANHPDVRLIRAGGNLGFARANNIGIEQSKGRHLALVNSDVLIRPDCLARLAAFMDQTPAAGITGPRVLNGDGTLQRSSWKFPTYVSAFARALALDAAFPRSPLFSAAMETWPKEEPREAEALSGCFLFARREAAMQVGGLDEGFFMYSEDTDWCKRFRDSGWKLMYEPRAEAIHFGGGSSSADPARFSLELQKAQLRYWRKHHGPLGAGYYSAILFLHQLLRMIPRLALFVFRPAQREAARARLAMNFACMRWLLRLSR